MSMSANFQPWFNRQSSGGQQAVTNAMIAPTGTAVTPPTQPALPVAPPTVSYSRAGGSRQPGMGGLFAQGGMPGLNAPANQWKPGALWNGVDTRTHGGNQGGMGGGYGGGSGGSM